MSKERDRLSAGLSRRDLLLTTAVGTVAWTRLAAEEAEANGPFLVRPYVQLGDSPRAAPEESLTVMWHATPNLGAWSVEFRSAGSTAWTPAGPCAGARIAVDGIPEHEVLSSLLKPLKPGKPAEYRVLLNGVAAFAAKASTRSPAEQPFRCVVMGDCGTGSPNQKKVAWQAHRRRPEFVLIPGDFVYENGRISEYRSFFYPAYTVESPSPEEGAPLMSNCCFLGGRGQHDTEASFSTHPDGHAFFLYWSFPQNGPVATADSRHVYPLAGSGAQEAAFREAAGGRFPRITSYSFDWGNSHWVVLDTWNPHIDWTDPALRDWLKSDLESARGATWKIVSSHMPPFNSSTKYPQGEKMRVIADIFEAAGVDIVFSGYAHSYQRTYPLRFRPASPPTGPIADPAHKVPGTFTFDKKFDGQRHTQPDGVVYVVSGCGGNRFFHSPEQTDQPSTWQPFTARYHASLHQFTQLDFDGRKLTARQISLEGDELDQFTLTKPS